MPLEYGSWHLKTCQSLRPHLYTLSLSPAASLYNPVQLRIRSHKCTRVSPPRDSCRCSGTTMAWLQALQACKSPAALKDHLLVTVDINRMPPDSDFTGSSPAALVHFYWKKKTWGWRGPYAKRACLLAWLGLWHGEWCCILQKQLWMATVQFCIIICQPCFLKQQLKPDHPACFF